MCDEVHVAVAAHELSARVTLGWLSVWLRATHTGSSRARSLARARRTDVRGRQHRDERHRAVAAVTVIHRSLSLLLIGCGHGYAFSLTALI